MAALRQGVPGGVIVDGPPPSDRDPFVVWGQGWLAADILPAANRTRRPFWHIDNGFWQPGRGSSHGFYRMTYRSLSPILLRDVSDLHREPIAVRRWRTDGKHVLIALPGADFGKPLGINVAGWIQNIEKNVRANTDRPIVVRPKGCSVPLSAQLINCWALVTHSSSVAVEAVLLGIPVFVAPTSPAAPVGRLDLNIECPNLPDRNHWVRSLTCQQFTIDEMYSGIAYHWMQRIAAQVDGAVDENRPHEAASFVG